MGEKVKYVRFRFTGTLEDLNEIKEEVENAKKTFIKYKWPTIDVTRKSVEEVAASIIKIHEIYKSNG